MSPPTSFTSQIVDFWPKATSLTSKFMYIQLPVDLVWFEGDAIYIHRYIHIRDRFKGE